MFQNRTSPYFLWPKDLPPKHLMVLILIIFVVALVQFLPWSTAFPTSSIYLRELTKLTKLVLLSGLLGMCIPTLIHLDKVNKIEVSALWKTNMFFRSLSISLLSTGLILVSMILIVLLSDFLPLWIVPADSSLSEYASGLYFVELSFIEALPSIPSHIIVGFAYFSFFKNVLENKSVMASLLETTRESKFYALTLAVILFAFTFIFNLIDDFLSPQYYDLLNTADIMFTWYAVTAFYIPQLNKWSSQK